MARLPRVVIHNPLHHITQGGNRRQRMLFEEQDYQLHSDLLADAARRAHCSVWAYCLMPNHVHAIVVPRGQDASPRKSVDQSLKGLFKI